MEKLNAVRRRRTDAKLSPVLEVSTRRAGRVGLESLKGEGEEKTEHSFAPEDFADRRGEIAYARARDDDRIAATVCFLGDAQESSAVVFTKLNVETFPLDLQ